MKTNKLKLNDLKVESFVTKFDKQGELTVNGGKGVAANTGPFCTQELGGCRLTFEIPCINTWVPICPGKVA